ncbi:MAG: hypothetical protein SXU28_00740 [Pseudomonadota bacterium]|nr:hypothetical protein [Pseudomonadota bacterium]
MPSSTSSSEARPARARVLALVAFAFGLVALGLGAWLLMPLSPVSTERYLAAAEDHVEMLRRSKGEKKRIVLLGGSGTAFSISAESLTQTLDRPVYNGGIQAGIGLRNLIDLYRPELDPQNDLIVLLPEPEMLAADTLHSQTWCDVLFLRKDIGRLAKRPRCVPNVMWRTWQELEHHAKATQNTDSVYRRSGFNARGDLVAHLSIESEAPDFSEYKLPTVSAQQLSTVTDHVRASLANDGFELLYVPAAMPQKGCDASRSPLAVLASELSASTSGAKERRTIDTAPYCLSDDLFFDGAGHLNAKGRAIHTANVAEAIRRHLAARP